MLDSLPILYSFRRCPYAMRARLALYSNQIEHEHREVDLKHKPHEMLEISAKGTVPVLQLKNGDVVDESLDIMTWAFRIPQLSGEALQLITENDTIFKQALDRYKYPDRYGNEDAESHRDVCLKFLHKLEKQLDPWLAGKDLSLIDMAILPFVRQFARVNPVWFEQQPFPHVRGWLAQFISSLLFQEIMKQYAPWSPQDQPVYILF